MDSAATSAGSSRAPEYDHVPPGPYTWLSAPPPPPGTELSGIADELGLGVEIPAVLKQFDGDLG